ncbi:ArgE/DapE family deacylase [Lentilactobacillus kosonis]|uniref:Probable succinyl-diaminopimelate desuccinylase n=1 Tax=Lentilactobacillus kosonis TaxID=2810561 RepID=A0A401FNB4_9LACO|nr:ArgE/DapE family deacylase [Lentilactobacillus kosonis]GAY73879.1 acetylornithine deacetylase [Lentilactobacillus kosonis]
MEQAEKIDILRHLVEINSVNGNELSISKYISEKLAEHGIGSEIDEFGDNRANLVAEIGDGTDKRVLAFEGHQDTVALGDETKWTHEPLKFTLVGDQAYGRGTADMKSGLAAQIIALIELTEHHIPITGKLRFIATAGEEYGTPGANRLNEQGIAKDISAMVVGEPTGGEVIFAHSGSLNYQIKSYGKAVHSSTPEQGINAINGIVKYINREASLFDDIKQDEYLGPVKHSVTLIKGGDQVNIIPEYAEIYGNIRPTLKFPNNQVIDRIQQVIAEINETTDYQLEFSLIHNFYPVETNPNNEFIKLVVETAELDYVDRKSKLSIINGATDASVFIQSNSDMPVVILGPDAWDKAHQVDEFTTLTSFFETINTYEEIAKKYLHKQ